MAIGVFDTPPLSLRDGERLATRFWEDGYVFLRGVLEPDRLHDLRGRFLTIAADALSPDLVIDRAQMSGINGSTRLNAVVDEMWRLEAVHTLPHHPVLLKLASILLGPAVMPLPKPFIRVKPPVTATADLTTPAHQDYPEIQGAIDTITMWVPLVDCSLDMGPLVIAAGSHVSGVRPFRPSPLNGNLETEDWPGVRWVTDEFKCGDLVVFHSLTVHKGINNRSRDVRISLDFRYQRSGEDICDQSVRMYSPGDWTALYGEWSDYPDDLRWYWNRHGVRVVPFDYRYLATRDDIAIEMGMAGQSEAIAGLRKASLMSPDQRVRRKALELLTGLRRTA